MTHEYTQPTYGPDEQFRIYERRGKNLRLLATAPSPQALGLALVTLASEGQLADGQLGILDGVAGHWLANPFNRPEDAPRFALTGEVLA